MIVETASHEMKWDPDKSQVDSFVEKSATEAHVFCLSLHDKGRQFLRIKMTAAERQQVMYAIQQHTPIVGLQCPRCGNTTYRVVPEKHGPHFGTVECDRCGRFVRWASRNEALKAAGNAQAKVAPVKGEVGEYLRADWEVEAGRRER